MTKYYTNVKVKFSQTFDLTIFPVSQALITVAIPPHETFKAGSVYKNTNSELILIDSNPHIHWNVDDNTNTVTCSILSSISPELLKEGDLITLYLEL